MEIKRINDHNTINAIELIQGPASCSDGYYAKYRAIDDMNFVLWCNRHACKRGTERGYMTDNSFFMDRFIHCFTQDDDTFWSMLEYKEAIMLDEEYNEAFLCRMSSAEVNGVVINSVYLKTYLALEGRRNVFINKDDGVVGNIPGVTITRK